jgi:hypothetical protein
MRRTIALLTILTFSFSLSAQSSNPFIVPANQENVYSNSVSFAEQNVPLFAQNNTSNEASRNQNTNSTRASKLTPKADLPKEPNNAFLQKLQNDPDELTDAEKQEFVNLLYDFYRVSSILSQQLDEVGKPTRNRLEAPPITGINQIEDAEDLDLTMALRRQIEQARRLTREVESIDLPVSNLKIEELQNNIIAISRQCDSTNFSLKQQINELNQQLEESQLNEMKNESYKELYYGCKATIRNHKGQINRSTVPALSVYAGATTNIFNDERYSSTFAPSIGMSVSPSSFLGIPDIIDVWAEYSSPTAKIKNHYGYYDTDYYTIEHNLSNIATGINLRFSLSQYFNIESFNWILKGGVGHFWMVDKMPNSNYTTNIWQGCLYRVETEVINFASQFPIGVYASYSLMKTYSNLISNNVNNFDFDNRKFGTLNFGLKFFISAHSPLSEKER